MAKGTTYQDPDKPTLMGEIVNAALSLFAEGLTVQVVFLDPTRYVPLMEEVGRQVNFQELYGKIVIEIYGIFITVKRADSAGKPWTQDKWFEVQTEEQHEQAAPFGETLIQKIVRVWESCDQQCTRGFPCPLLAEVGVNMHGEALDACTALRDVETLMGGDEAALDVAAESFYNDKARASQETQENQEE